MSTKAERAARLSARARAEVPGEAEVLLLDVGGGEGGKTLEAVETLDRENGIAGWLAAEGEVKLMIDLWAKDISRFVLIKWYTH